MLFSWTAKIDWIRYYLIIPGLIICDRRICFRSCPAKTIYSTRSIQHMIHRVVSVFVRKLIEAYQVYWQYNNYTYRCYEQAMVNEKLLAKHSVCGLALWSSELILATQISYIAKIKSGVIVEIQLWQKLEILLPKTLFSYITVLLCGVK